MPDPITILVCLLLSLAFVVIIGKAILKYNGDDGKPWEHEKFEGRWEE